MFDLGVLAAVAAYLGFGLLVIAAFFCAMTLPQKIKARRKRQVVASSACRHRNADPVKLLDGRETVAWLCTDCGEQLPADFDQRIDQLFGGALSGVTAYWVDEVQELVDKMAERSRTREATVITTLVSAGFRPDDALDLCNGHSAQACPKRIYVTGLRDASPRYIHGACTSTPAS